MGTAADGLKVLTFDQAKVKAEQWFKQKAAEDAGEIVAGSYTVAAAMTDYIKHLTKLKREPQHRTQAVADALILPALGKIELSKLTHSKVKAWRDALAESAPRVRTRVGKVQAFRSIDADDPDEMRKRQATTNRILTVLKAALNYAYEEKRVSSRAAWEVVKPFRRVDVPKVRFLSKDEVTALITVCEPDFQRLVMGALLTGARYGELTTLTVGNFNIRDGNVFIAKSKNGEQRYIDLNAAGIELFTELTKGKEAKEVIFVRSNGKAWKASEQKRPMDAACAAANIEGVTFHILRHTYASHAVENGMPIEVVASVLGHKDTRITMRHYAHLSRTYKQKIVRENAPSFGFINFPGPSGEGQYPSLPTERKAGQLLAMARA